MTVEQQADDMSPSIETPILGDSEIPEQVQEEINEAHVADEADKNRGNNNDNIELKNQIEELTTALKKAQDLTLRAQAEVQNTKRRAVIDVEKAHKFALEKFIESLLPVVDSLEKGLDSAAQAEGEQDAIKEGMTLTLKLFLDTLARFQVKPISPEGEPFDPHFHQAMSMVPNPDVETNTVMEVFQKGYMLNDRVLRPAMVVVSTGV